MPDLKVKCTKFDFDFPRPRWGSLQRSPRHPYWILGPLRGRGGAELGKRRERGRGRGGKGS